MDPNRNFRDEIDGAKVEEIVEEFGSPVFVISEKTIRETYREVNREFSSRYSKARFSWSYKTNYLDAVVTIRVGPISTLDLGGSRVWLGRTQHHPQFDSTPA